MSRSKECSPLTRECAQLVQRWSESTVSLLETRRPERKKTSSCATTTANWIDSFAVEVEDVEAETVAVFDLF